MAFGEFEGASMRYIEVLRNPQTIKQSEEYAQKVEDDYVEALLKAQTYLKDFSVSTVEQSEARSASTGAETGSTEQVVAAGPAWRGTCRDAFTPEKFDGSSLKYPMWKASVDAFMLSQGDMDYSIKMFHLRRFITGDALSAIENCFLTPNRATYNEAWSILEERFGNAVLVTSAFRKKIDDWPKIGDRDRKALQQFSDFLKQVQVASLTYEKLSVLDDEFENEKLVKKIPNWLASKWIARVVRDASAFPKFKRFVEFISEHAKI